MTDVNADEADPLEAEVRALLRRSDTAAAATLAIRARGSEILRFLTSLLDDPEAAGDAFSLFAERLWSTLDRFAWRCSLRSWCFRLARNAAMDLKRGARPRGREIPLSEASEIERLAANVRTETASVLRHAQSELDALRATLSEEDRLLLILRLEQKLAWLDLARVFLGDDATDEDLRRESGRLRKRFQLAKARFVEAARARGLGG